jgi:AraC-like DNA-binding protein
MSGARPAPPHSVGKPSRILFASDLVSIGEFRCAVDHPLFDDSGPTRGYCFVFPRTAVWIQHEGGPAFVADSTVVPLYNPGYPYKRRAISADGDRTDWFAVSPALLREMLASYGAASAEAETRLFGASFAPSPAATFARQRAVFLHAQRSPAHDRLYLEESVVSILGDVLAAIHGRVGRDAVLKPRQRDLVEGTRERLAKRFTNDEGLAGIAAATGASVFHLCRVFKQVTGHTIHHYRNELRLRRALEVLQDNNHDILRTALDLGYSGHSHFTRTFHRMFGLPPSAFRALAAALSDSLRS